MGEICRVINRRDHQIIVAIEPWGTQYDVQSQCYLRVYIDEDHGFIEIESYDDGSMSIYLSECTFDDISTKVDRIKIYE